MYQEAENVIIRVDDKPTPGTIVGYNGNARPGEIIIDPTVVPPVLYIGDKYGNIRSDWVGGAGGGGGGGTGTVTSIATAGGGLGFTLSGGPITTTGTVTLTVPTAAALRVSIGDGNVANVLRGDGTFSSAPSTSSISNGTSTVSIPTVSGDVVTTAGGVATLTVTSTGANITGTANITGVANVGGNLNVAGNLAISGNVTTAIVANASVPSTTTSTGTIILSGTGGIGLGGNIHVGGNANVAGNLHALGNSILGSNSNVFISGGTVGQVLSATGVGGALQWTTASSFPTSVPDLEWAALADGTNQMFSNPELAHYNSLTSAITVFKDGIKLSNAAGDYTLAGTNLTINTWIGTGSIISVGAGYRLV